MIPSSLACCSGVIFSQALWFRSVPKFGISLDSLWGWDHRAFVVLQAHHAVLHRCLIRAWFKTGIFRVIVRNGR